MLCCTLFAAFTSALFESKSASVSVCPPWEAAKAGVRPSCMQTNKMLMKADHFFKWKFCWKQKNQCVHTAARCQLIYETKNMLSRDTLNRAFTSALFKSRSARVSVCPLSEAKRAGVLPSCINEKNNILNSSYVLMSQNGLHVIINVLILIKFLILENFALLYIVRRIYICFIWKKQRKSFSVSIVWSCNGWGITILYKCIQN
jgi:hypothetical protein